MLIQRLQFAYKVALCNVMVTIPISTDVNWWMDLANQNLLSGDLAAFSRATENASPERLRPGQKPEDLAHAVGSAVGAFLCTQLGQPKSVIPKYPYALVRAHGARRLAPSNLARQISLANDLIPELGYARSYAIKEDKSRLDQNGKPTKYVLVSAVARAPKPAQVAPLLSVPIRHPYPKAILAVANLRLGRVRTSELRKVYAETRTTAWSVFVLSELMFSKRSSPEDRVFARAEVQRQSQAHPKSPVWNRLKTGKGLFGEPFRLASEPHGETRIGGKLLELRFED